MYPIEPQTNYTIRFQDCDPFGHLNNARYLDYIITAREDHLKEYYQLDQQQYMKNGLGWVIQHHEIMYLKPVKVYDTVSIQTSLIGYTDHYVWVEGCICGSEETELKAVLWSKLYHVDIRRGEKAKHSEELMQLFPQVINKKIDSSLGLKARVSQLLSSTVSS